MNYTSLTDAEVIEQIVIDVKEEVLRATSLHGPFPSLHHAYGVIAEEFDEFWEQVKVNPRKLCDEAQQLRIANMREELVQIAAMCVRTIMDMRL